MSHRKTKRFVVGPGRAPSTQVPDHMRRIDETIEAIRDKDGHAHMIHRNDRRPPSPSFQEMRSHEQRTQRM